MRLVGTTTRIVTADTDVSIGVDTCVSMDLYSLSAPEAELLCLQETVDKCHLSVQGLGEASGVGSVTRALKVARIIEAITATANRKLGECGL